ncbi:MAG TPA: carbonic anhydrase, partial [Epsilonproteobacteria bacterium]|nr:carbonic anhydrase [Campylobacterota bacterium]
IEYAVSILGVNDIIVCGHSHCGAINALFTPPKVSNNLEIIHTLKWLELGMAAKNDVENVFFGASDDIKQSATEKLSIIYQLENLLTYPAIKDKVSKKELFLHGWYYEIESGTISYYDDKSDRFEPL